MTAGIVDCFAPGWDGSLAHVVIMVACCFEQCCLHRGAWCSRRLGSRGSRNGAKMQRAAWCDSPFWSASRVCWAFDGRDFSLIPEGRLQPSGAEIGLPSETKRRNTNLSRSPRRPPISCAIEPVAALLGAFVTFWS